MSLIRQAQKSGNDKTKGLVVKSPHDETQGCAVHGLAHPSQDITYDETRAASGLHAVTTHQ